MSYRKLVSGLTLTVAVAIAWLVAPTAQASPHPPSNDSYTIIDTDLTDLRDRFNADRGKVRAVFLASPTCGICLRGVADLQKAMLDQIDAEDLVVYVVWSSQLGAEERHVEPGMRLIGDVRTVHYWDPDQLIGIAYQPVFDISVPIWDYWLLYDRTAEWGATAPPKPNWYEYQGRPFGRPAELQLDAHRFADKTREILAQQ